MCCYLLWSMYSCVLIWLWQCMCSNCICIVQYGVSGGCQCAVVGICMHSARPRCMWTWSVWCLMEDVNAAWECGTPTVPGSQCHLAVAFAASASTQSSVSCCQDAAGAFWASVPTLKGTGGHGHLSCLFSQHTAQGGQAGPGPSPLNSTGPLLSPGAQQWAQLSLPGYTNQGGDLPSAHKRCCHFDTGNQSACLYEKHTEKNRAFLSIAPISCSLFDCKSLLRPLSHGSPVCDVTGWVLPLHELSATNSKPL